MMFSFTYLIFKFGIGSCSLVCLLDIECIHWGLAAPCSRLGIRFWTERTPFL